MGKKTHCHNRVSTQMMLESTTKIPKLVSPTGDEYPLHHLLPFLPYELIYDILLRVPVRSLLQFKCVCKSWNALISDPQFAKDHLFISTSDPNMTHQRVVYAIMNRRHIVSFSVHSLFQNPSKPAKPRRLRTSHDEEILGSCNGLLCLSHYKKAYCILRLWNPCTGLKSKRLSISISFATGFDFNGLGYDHVNHRYKVIATLVYWDEIETRDRFETKIYSFGSNSCTVIQNQNFPRFYTRMEGKFVSGTLNWIVKRGKSDDQWVILSLDMVTELFSEVFLPELDEAGDKICEPVLGVSRKCLCVCFFDSKFAYWTVSLMKEYGVRDSWIKLVMTPHVDRLRKYEPISQPLFISENGVVLLRTIGSNHLVLYNSNDGRLSYPRIRDILGFEMHIYLESLVSPKC